MFTCPCRKRAIKEPLTRKVLRQAVTSKRLVKGKNLKIMGGSTYYSEMPQAAITAMLPDGMLYYELAGDPYYPAPADLLDIVPPTQTPVPNPPLVGTALEWRTPTQIWGKKAALFILGKCDKQPASWGDVNEGSLGDCWLMAAIAAVARYGVAANLFSGITGPNPPTVTITLCEQDGPYGGFQTQFPVTVTTEVPVDANGNLVYVKSDSPGEYWPCMIEKAVAAVLWKNGTNGYAAIQGGKTNFGIGLMLPGNPFEVFLNTDANNNITTSATDLYNAWYKLMKAGITIDVSFNAVSSTVLPNGQLPGNQGLLADHAYTIFALVDAPLGTAPPKNSTPKVHLALLRNPYGQGTTCSTPNGGEWAGNWSNCDNVNWAANPWVAQACNYKGDKYDGLFWMTIDDILANMVGYYGAFFPTDPALKAIDLTQNPLGGSAVTVAQSTTCENVTFNIQTKKNAYQLGWSVPGTDIYVPAGTYQNKTPYSTTACLEPGTYTFHATDTYGTGWNGGTFSVTVGNNTVVNPTTVPNGVNAMDVTFNV